MKYSRHGAGGDVEVAMMARLVLLVLLVLIEPVFAQPTAGVPYPRNYKTSLVKYATVDRSDGFSRDLYASREAVEAVRTNPRLQELPVGVVLALDVYSAREVSRDRKTGAITFETTREGHLVHSKSERTLHLMQKTLRGFGSQTWTFGGYDPLTAAPSKLELPGDCLLCHQAAVVSDMAFSLSLLKRFAATGAVQYSFCQHPGRQACAF